MKKKEIFIASDVFFFRLFSDDGNLFGESKLLDPPTLPRSRPIFYHLSDFWVIRYSRTIGDLRYQVDRYMSVMDERSYNASEISSRLRCETIFPPND